MSGLCLFGFNFNKGNRTDLELFCRWLGEFAGSQGWFPCAYVIELDDTDFEDISESDKIVQGQSTPFCQKERKEKRRKKKSFFFQPAMWTHSPSHREELSFKRGDLIRVLWDEDPYWCCGEKLSTKTMGWFPANMVALWIEKEED